MTDESGSANLFRNAGLVRTQDTTHLYDGTYGGVYDSWICRLCSQKSVEGEQMLICQTCKTVRYCSEDCRNQDRVNHRWLCFQIGRFNGCLPKLDAEIGFPGAGHQELVHYIQENRASFVKVVECCNTRRMVIRLLQKMGTAYPVRPLFETILAYKLKLLRLERRDKFDMEFEVPFTLLTLNRDEDCHRYIKRYLMEQTEQDHAGGLDFGMGNEWNNLGIQGPASSGEPSTRDGMHPMGAEKFGDVIKPPVEREDVPLACLASLCIVKLRIVEAYKARVRTFETFCNTSMGAMLCDSIKHVEGYYFGDRDERKGFEKQEVIVERYLRFMHEKNEFILVAIFDDFELRSFKLDSFEMDDEGDLFSCSDTFRALSERVDEAKKVLACTKKLFRDIPGLQGRIENVVGRKFDS